MTDEVLRVSGCRTGLTADPSNGFCRAAVEASVSLVAWSLLLGDEGRDRRSPSVDACACVCKGRRDVSHRRRKAERRLGQLIEICRPVGTLTR